MLEQVFDFDKADLLLNQNGRFSEKQIKLLTAYQNRLRFYGRLGFLVIFLSLGGFSIVALYNIGFDLEKNRAPIIAYAAFCLIGFSIYLFTLLIGKLRSDLKSQKISKVEGPAELTHKKHPRSLGISYFATIDGVKFQLDTPAKYQALESGKNYRIFYIKHPPIHIILSISEI